MNGDEAVYPSFYLRHHVILSKVKVICRMLELGLLPDKKLILRFQYL